MIIFPELYDWIGIRVLQPRLAQVVESGNSGPSRIGNQAVNRFLAVDVGLVLKVPAERVAGRLRQQANNL
jgi:hypothetical protein